MRSYMKISPFPCRLSNEKDDKFTPGIYDSPVLRPPPFLNTTIIPATVLSGTQSGLFLFT